MTARRMHAECQERESQHDAQESERDPANQQESNAAEEATIDVARIQRASRGCLEKWLCSRVPPNDMQDLYDHACMEVAAAEQVANVEMQIRRMKKPALVILCRQLSIEGGPTVRVGTMRDAVTQYYTQSGNNDSAQLLSQIEAAKARADEDKAAAEAAAAAAAAERQAGAQQAPQQAPAPTPPPPTYGFSIDQLHSIALQNPLLFQQMLLAFQAGQNYEYSPPAGQSEQAGV